MCLVVFLKVNLVKQYATFLWQQELKFRYMTICYTIIIPVKTINDYVRETVNYIQKLTKHEWELLIIPNDIETNEWQDDKRIKVIQSGDVGPADKRDLGAKQAVGEILVFLDDDSYPEANLLEVATKYFTDSDVIALGGPGVTPPSDSFWQRVSGAVFLSRFTGGAPERMCLSVMFVRWMIGLPLILW